MKLGTEVGLGPAIHCVRWGPRSLQRKGHNNSNFPLMSIVAKRYGLIKIKFVSKVDLDSGHIVLDGDHPSHPEMAQQSPIFDPCLLWANGLPSQLLLSTHDLTPTFL